MHEMQEWTNTWSQGTFAEDFYLWIFFRSTYLVLDPSSKLAWKKVSTSLIYSCSRLVQCMYRTIRIPRNNFYLRICSWTILSSQSKIYLKFLVRLCRICRMKLRIRVMKLYVYREYYTQSVTVHFHRIRRIEEMRGFTVCIRRIHGMKLTYAENTLSETAYKHKK
jgi:hypothetical protein